MYSHAPINPKSLYSAIGSAKSVKLGLASNPESSSAWVKTVIDPAHAREYGCRGIPDENQQPTLVLQGRDTFTINQATFLDTSATKWFWSADAGKYVEIGVSGLMKNISISEIFIIQGELYRHTFAIAHCIADVESSQLTETSVEGYIIRGYSGLVNLSGTNNLEHGQEPARLISQSYTFDWIGREIDRSGYIEAGHTWTNEDVPRYQGSLDKQYQPTLDLINLGNLVTYTGSYEQGVYIASMFNNYDAYRWWKGRSIGNFFFSLHAPNRATAGSYVYGVRGDSVADYWAPSHLGSSRKSFIRYACLPKAAGGYEDTWSFRLTVNQAVEVMVPYNAGGSDSAIYDHASVEDVIAMYDAFDLIFPASYNDFRKVWNWIKSNAPKAAGFAASVLRHFPQTRSLADALAVLIGEKPMSLSQAVAAANPQLAAQAAAFSTIPMNTTKNAVRKRATVLALSGGRIRKNTKKKNVV